MSKQKAQGTREESALRDAANTRPGLTARRAENNAASRDVEIDTHARRIVVESKATERLNAHGVLERAIKANPGEPVRLNWKRVVASKPGAKRRVAAGPTFIAVPQGEYLNELAVLSAAERLADVTDGRRLSEVEEAMDRLRAALAAMHAVHPDTEENP